MTTRQRGRRGGYFPPDIVRMVKEFPSAYHGETRFSPKVQEIISINNFLLRSLWEEVKPMFQEEEWNYIYDMLHSSVLLPPANPKRKFSYRTILAIQTEDADIYENLGEKWNVDIPALVTKIRGLTEAQALAVAKAADAFWTQETREGEE